MEQGANSMPGKLSADLIHCWQLPCNFIFFLASKTAISHTETREIKTALFSAA